MRTCLALAFLALSTSALAVPMEFTHQGRLLDSAGAPLATGDLTFALFESATGGTAAWEETHTGVALDAGFYSLQLGSVQALDSSTFDGATLWLEVSVDGAALAERVAVVSVPYAVKAGLADNVSEGAVLNVSELQIDGSTVVDGNGLAAGFGSDSFAELDCIDAGDVPTYDGSAWGCAPGMPDKIDVALLDGIIGLPNLPVGTTGDHIAAGNHSHTAAEVGALADSTTIGDLGGLPASTTIDDLGGLSADTTLDDLAGPGLLASTAADSCLKILEADSEAADGFYWLKGSDAPNLHECDMSNGGFTRLSFDTFDNGAGGWSNTTRTVCGSFGQILGGYNVYGQGMVVARTFDLSAWPHTELKTTADFIKIDSWDNEFAEMKWDDVNVWRQQLIHTGGEQECGVASSGGWREQSVPAAHEASHTADTFKLSFSSTLNQAANDESWGVDNVVVWVK